MANGQLQPEFTILGSFGELHDSEGNFLSNIQEVSAQVTIDRQDIMMSGSRRVGYKYTSVHGEGTMRGFRVSSLMARRVADVMAHDRVPQWTGDITIKLADPETQPVPGDATRAPQIERIKLKRCKWWGINLGWAVNQIVEEDTPFTFQDIEWLSEIRGTLSDVGGSAAITPPAYVPNLPDLPTS